MTLYSCRSLRAPLRHTDDAYVSFFPRRASIFLGSSQNARGERAKALGWEPQPVVLQDWAEEGISASLGKLQQ